jgi:hypothetical protein
VHLLLLETAVKRGCQVSHYVLYRRLLDDYPGRGPFVCVPTSL